MLYITAVLQQAGTIGITKLFVCYRDVAWLGSCDDGCLALAELLGWKVRIIAQNNDR